MLHAITKLPRDRIGHVTRVLRHEIDADTLGANETYYLLDLLQKRLWRIAEEQMRLVEKEHELGLSGSPISGSSSKSSDNKNKRNVA